MPEVFALVAVFVVIVIAWVGAWMHARDPANHNPQAELTRLRQRAVWLEQRLELAEREKWGPDMISSLAAEMSATAEELRSPAEQTCAR